MPENNISRGQNTVNSRTVQHTSQRRLSVNSSPDAINLTPNGEPTLIYKPDGGLYWVVKHNGVNHNLKFQSGPIRDRNDYVERSLQINRDLLVQGELKGSRLVFLFGSKDAITTDGYMKTTNGVVMSADLGYTMHRDGSIVGASCRFECTSHSSNSTWNVDVLINNTTVFQTDTVSVTSATEFSTYGSQARNIDKFVAGDEMQVKMNVASGTTTTIDNMIGYVEVVFDT